MGGLAWRGMMMRRLTTYEATCNCGIADLVEGHILREGLENTLVIIL